MKKVNRRTALKVFGGAAGSFLVTGRVEANSLPVALFKPDEVMVTQDVLSNEDEILGDWKIITTSRPLIRSDAAYFQIGTWKDCPFDYSTVRCVQRRGTAIVQKHNALDCFDTKTRQLVKAWGVIHITQTRWLIPSDINLTCPLPKNSYRQVTSFKVTPESQLSAC